MKASYIPCSYIHTMHTIGHGAILLTCHSIDISYLHDYAQKLYRKMLGVEIEATITDLYSADEVVMIRRNVDQGA